MRYLYSCLLIILLFSISTISPAQTQGKPSISPKIIGGKASDFKQWPWMAGLVNTGLSIYQGQYCGAALVAPQWVITAAHCVVDETVNSINVIVGRDDLLVDEGELHSVDEIVIHPDFDISSLINDIALVKLSQVSRFTPIQTLGSFSTLDGADQVGIAMGWGTVFSFLERYPFLLREVELPIISNQLCQRNMPGTDILDTMLCAGLLAGGVDTCSGDSGGPLIVFDEFLGEWRMAGITSFGLTPCAAANQFGIYTRLKEFKSFISDTICTVPELPAPPSLNLQQQGRRITASWNNDFAEGYRLFYAPFPSMSPIFSLDLGQDTSISVDLSPGDAFFVFVNAYNGNCISDDSVTRSFSIQ